MNYTPQTIAESPLPSSGRASSVLIGRQDYISVLLRLIGMELYKIRRRVMSKVLGIISILATIGLFALFAFAVFLVTQNASPAPEIQGISEPLRLPLSLYLIAQLLLLLGQILIVILTSTIIGGEYSSGTIRLMLTRGPSRTQFLLAKAGTGLIIAIIGVIGVAVLGVLSSLLLNLTSGVAQSFDFFSAAWLAHTLIFFLIIILGLFVYAMMALFLSTLGRATAAGIAGVLVWSFLIEPIINFLGAFGSSIGGPAGDFFRALPDYTIGKSIAALLAHQAPYVFGSNVAAGLYGSQAGYASSLHALLVLAVYLAIFIGVALWAIVHRDVTN